MRLTQLRGGEEIFRIDIIVPSAHNDTSLISNVSSRLESWHQPVGVDSERVYYILAAVPTITTKRPPVQVRLEDIHAILVGECCLLLETRTYLLRNIAAIGSQTIRRVSAYPDQFDSTTSARQALTRFCTVNLPWTL
jgi:hypothetical protein